MTSIPGRSVRIAALVVAWCLLAVTPATAATAGAVTARRAEPVASSLRIASYNVSAGVRVSRTVRDLREIAALEPDVIALQEMASWKRRQAVRAALVDCDTCVYGAHIPGPAVPGGTPILYRADRFTLLDTGSVKVTEDTYVGPRGAGPNTIRAKWVNWVRLRDNATRRPFYVLNNHFVPTVQAGHGGPNDNRRRVEIYRKHMAALVGLIQELRGTTGGGVFVTGDFNVNYRNDSVRQAPIFPYHALGAIGVHSSFQNLSVPAEGTHVLSSGYSKRLIDYVLNLGLRWVGSQDHRIVFGLSSDHRPLVSDYTLWGRGCFQRHQNVC